MIKEVKAKVFLGSERGVTETDWFRTANLLNAGKYISEQRESFGDLYLLNEETLSPGRSLTCEAISPSYIIIMPVWGSLKYVGLQHGTFRIHPGELLLVPACRRHSYSLFNEMGNDSVQFIQVGFKTTDDVAEINPQLRSMEVKEYHNHLHAAINNYDPFPFQFFIGQYEGRVKDKCEWPGAGKPVFVYVIQGAIELNNQFLHAGDGIGISDCNQLKWEAVSGYALFIVVAMKSD